MSIDTGTGRWVEAAGEVDRRLRGLRRAIGQAERGGDAEAGRPDRREAGVGERGGRRVVPRVREDEAAGGAGRRTRSSHALDERERVRLAGAAARPGAEGAAGEVDEDDPAVGTDTAGGGHGQIIPPDEPGRRLARLDEDRDARGDDLRLAAAGAGRAAARSASSAPGCDVCGW